MPTPPERPKQTLAEWLAEDPERGPGDAIRLMRARMRETHGGYYPLIDGLLKELPKPLPPPPPPPSPLAGYAPERIARARKKLKAILSDEENQRKIVEYAMEAQRKRLHPEPFQLKPRTRPSARPYVASVGRFLCERSATPPLIDVDELSIEDIKQDACLRAIIALRRAGKPVGPDPIAAFDAEPRLVQRCWNLAYRDAVRVHLGRHSVPDRRVPRWQRQLSLDWGFEEIADAAQGEALERVIDDTVAIVRLNLLKSKGLPAVPQKMMVRLIRQLERLQRLREEGLTVVPPYVRMSLHRIRQSTKLPIDLDLL